MWLCPMLQQVPKEISTSFFVECIVFLQSLIRQVISYFIAADIGFQALSDMAKKIVVELGL
jgi:hypothetical protein